MSTTMELIKELHDRRRGIVEEQRELHSKIEAGSDPDGEAQQAFDRMNKDISDLGSRIGNLTSMLENEKASEIEREKFAKLIHSEQEDPAASGFAESARTWLRAAAGGDVWAPRYFDVKLGNVGVSEWDRKDLLERHDLTKGTSTAGAELIPTGFVRTLYQHLIEFAAVRQTNAEVFRTNSGENLLIPKTTGYGTAAIVAEAGAIAESDPAFAQVTIGAYKYGQLIQISRELIEDSAVDILGFLAKAAGIAIGTANGAHLVTGTGSGQPQGIANAPTAGVTGGAGTGLTITGDQLIALYHSVVSGYRRNAYWVMNDATAAAVRTLKDSSGGSGIGNYLWQPGLTAGAPDQLLGRPVVFDPTMPVMAINAYSVAFGDFSLYYAIRDVDGVRFERSDDFAFANDLVSFRSIFRTDAKQLVNGAGGAVKFYRNGAS